METRNRSYMGRMGSNMDKGSTQPMGDNVQADSGGAFAKLAFNIEKLTVTAHSRSIPATYTIEFPQEVNNFEEQRGLDAEEEINKILREEIAEIIKNTGYDEAITRMKENEPKTVAIKDENGNDLVVPYTIRRGKDIAFYYCPYIPLLMDSKPKIDYIAITRDVVGGI
jgi:hypothetical protein